jgi:hypothetical protein
VQQAGDRLLAVGQLTQVLDEPPPACARNQEAPTQWPRLHRRLQRKPLRFKEQKGKITYCS